MRLDTPQKLTSNQLTISASWNMRWHNSDSGSGLKRWGWSIFVLCVLVLARCLRVFLAIPYGVAAALREPFAIAKAGSITFVGTHSRSLPIIWNEVCKQLQCRKFNVKTVQTENWVQQCRGRHRSLCSNWCRPLYGAQPRVDTALSTAVQGPS
jgi:hypothetical protein